MSKNFEAEYKKLAFDQVPDLWDRIEAGLSEKSTPKMDEMPKQDRNQTEGKGVIFFRRYAGAVAAVLCVVTIIPAAVYIGKGGSKSYSESAVDGAAVTTETSIEEMVAEAPAEEAASEETFEATMKAVEEEAAEAETGILNDYGAEMSKESAAGSIEEMKQESVADAIKQESVSEESMQAEASKLRSEEVIRASVKIGDGELQVNEAEEAEGRWYEATVMKVDSEQLAENQEIRILVPITSSEVIGLEKETLEMDLIYDFERDIYIMQKLYSY